MWLNKNLLYKNISNYYIAEKNDVPETTKIDIYSSKNRIEKHPIGTLQKIANTLNISIKSLIGSKITKKESMPYRSTFEVFKSNICHFVKDKGDIDFLIDTLEKDEIRKLYNRGWYPEAFYMLAMVDYLSHENDIPQCCNYNDMRSQSLKDTIYPLSVILLDEALHTDSYKKESLNKAIPEFKRFNIIKSEIRDIC